jgi:hypothetical protein
MDAISPLAESADRIGLRMLASPMDAVMYSVRRPGLLFVSGHPKIGLQQEDNDYSGGKNENSADGHEFLSDQFHAFSGRKCLKITTHLLKADAAKHESWKTRNFSGNLFFVLSCPFVFCGVRLEKMRGYL